MARRFIGRRRRRSGPRRQTDWIVSAQGQVIDPTPTTSVNQSIALLNNQDLLEHDDQFTVERIVGQVHFSNTQGTDWVAAPRIQCWSGIALLETDATGASIDLAPDDGVDGDSEAWMWRNYQMWTPPGIYDATLQRILCWGITLDIDCRVRRKMKGREHLVMFYRLDDNTGQSNNFFASFQLRTLVKLT